MDLFLFIGSRCAETFERIFTIYTSYDVFPRKDVPFGGPVVTFTFIIAILKIQHGGRPLSWKVEKSPYLSNGLADLDEIWHAYADWLSEAYQPVKIWIFENPRWQLPPFWKTVKSQYLRNRLTNFHEIWHGDAHWHFLYQRIFKIAILKIQHGGRSPSWKIKKSPYLSNGSTILDKI